MGATSIQWTDHSINPLRFGSGHYCQKISPGCAHCYASRLQPRFGNSEFGGVSSTVPHRTDEQRNGGLWLDENKLREVLRRNKPTRYFWCDMTDLFGDWVSDEWIVKCLATMALTPHHTHQVLTKRPERMRRVMLAPNAEDAVDHMAFHLSHEMMMGDCYDSIPEAWPLPNVWLGVSVESDEFRWRILELLRTPAAVHFVSAEPLLGPLDLSWIPFRDGSGWQNPLTGQIRTKCQGVDGNPDFVAETIHPGLPKLKWLIVGGESGHNARPCDVAWVRSLVEQCKAAGVACFVKQLGSKPVELMVRPGCSVREALEPLCLRDHKGGSMKEWPEDLCVRQFPEVL